MVPRRTILSHHLGEIVQLYRRDLRAEHSVELKAFLRIERAARFEGRLYGFTIDDWAELPTKLRLFRF